MASVCVNVDRRGYSESQEGKGNTMHLVKLEVHSTHLQLTLSSDPQKLMTTYLPTQHHVVPLEGIDDHSQLAIVVMLYSVPRLCIVLDAKTQPHIDEPSCQHEEDEQFTSPRGLAARDGC